MHKSAADYQIRPLTSEDESILWEMLYQGLQSTGAGTGPTREMMREPDFARYVEGWGRAEDHGFIAFERAREQPIGAVWCRDWCYAPGGGETSLEVPELAFAVRSDYRRRGIGVALLTQWVRANPQQSAVILRASTESPAVRLYERFGFRVTEESPGSVTMRRGD